MKYKKGDRVRLISKPTKYTTTGVEKYLGKVVTISGIGTSIFSTVYYTIEEDDDHIHYFEDTIAGLASETPFDFSACIDKNVCMHCKTEEEAEDFCCEMDKAGLIWADGDSYLEMSCFDNYKEQTCYCFNRGTYNSTVYAKNKGYQILEWSDYRSTEPLKDEEQEKTMSKSDNKPLSFQETMDIYKRLCEHHRKRNSCRECPVGSFKNYTGKMCRDFLIENTDKVEPILKQWAAEHPVKSNRDKFVEFFGEIQKYDGECEHHCATVPCTSCNWWHQEYVEPYEEKE